MHILLLGLSHIAQRRVLPALAGLASIDTVDVASRSAQTADAVPERVRGRLYSDYDKALTSSPAELVYVSIVNSLHVSWVTRALELGFHVIVDKPCAPTLAEAKALTELARKKGRCLAEATVFTRHPQIAACRALLGATQSGGLRVSATFSFPPLDDSDFRYSRLAAGGSLSDLGPYAAATARNLFDAAPDYISCRVLARRQDVDIAFAVMMVFPGGGVLVGRFGFDTEYCNRLSILGPGISIELNRIYTTPPNLGSQIIVRRNNSEERIDTPAADSFLLFIQDVLGAVDSGRHETFAHDLLTDASTLDRLRFAAGEV